MVPLLDDRMDSTFALLTMAPSLSPRPSVTPTSYWIPGRPPQARETLASSFARRQVLAVPGKRGPHDLTERRLRIDLVVPVALEHHELLRLTGLSVELGGFLGRDEPVVGRGDEEDGARRDLIDDPLRIELQRVVDVLERDLAHRGGVRSEEHTS